MIEVSRPLERVALGEIGGAPVPSRMSRAAFAASGQGGHPKRAGVGPVRDFASARCIVLGARLGSANAAPRVLSSKRRRVSMPDHRAFHAGDEKAISGLANRIGMP